MRKNRSFTLKLFGLQRQVAIQKLAPGKPEAQSGDIMERFLRHLVELSEEERRARPHARRFYRDVLLPKLRAGEKMDPATLKDLIADYQRDKEGANFDVPTLHGFALIDHITRRDSEYLREKDPEGFEAAQKARELIEELRRAHEE